MFLVYLLLVIALFGAVLPILPGPLIAVGALGVFAYEQALWSSPTLWAWVIAGIVVFAMDYVMPSWLTKKSGGTRAGAIGALVGMIIGIFFAPIGLILGLMLGAFVGELIANQSEKVALRSAIFAFLGFLSGTAMKLTYVGLVIWWVASY